MIKSTNLIGRNYLFNYSAQSNCCIIGIFNRSFSKNKIETKDGWKFDKIYKRKFVRISPGLQIHASNTTNTNLIKEDVEWYGRANFEISYLIPMQVLFQRFSSD